MRNRSDVEVVELLEQCAASLHPEHVRPLVGSVLDEATADQVAATFAIIADRTRARIVHALSLADELCVCDLALVLGVSQSAMSHQLRLLRDHRVVARRRAGRIAYYRLADEHIRHIFAQGTRHALEDRDAATRGGATPAGARPDTATRAGATPVARPAPPAGTDTGAAAATAPDAREVAAG
jgi:ArsR family transcriptional regulator, lead/cadmium/zinc/bismuth-responsive transcriptional repressor